MNFLRPLRIAIVSLCVALSSSAQADNLLSVYTKALDGNPEYLSVIAGYQQAIEARPQALAKLLPQIGVSGEAATVSQTLSGRFFVGGVGAIPTSGSDVNRTDAFNSVGYQVGLTQVLFDRGLYLTLDTAALEVSRAGLLTYDAQDTLRIGVVEAYFAALSADEELRFAEAEKTAIEAVLAQTRDKSAAGLVADTEVQVAQSQLDLAAAALIAAKNAVAVSRVQLELLSGGTRFGALDGLSKTYLPVAPQPDSLDVWIERAGKQNLQLKAQMLATEIARKNVDKAYGARWPRVDALAAYTYQYAEGGISNGIGAEGNRATDERVGLQVKIPIFTGGAISSAIRAAQAGVVRAEADEAAKRADALRKVQVAFLNSSAAIAKVRALKQAVQSTTASEDAIRVGYEVGTRTNGDLLLALRSRYRAERDYAVARFDAILNSLRLRAAAGSLNHADLLAVNGALAAH
ncbi:MAG: TolC family outer membrane protein [Gammaproteobacteria bacterium]|nr:TolC family outer membrane protein [Gammaproteobacteria bacterium]